MYLHSGVEYLLTPPSWSDARYLTPIVDPVHNQDTHRCHHLHHRLHRLPRRC